MVGNRDRLTWDGGPGHIRDMDFSASQEKIPGQIEITIEKITLPGNRYRGSAHHPGQDDRIEGPDQFLSIRFQGVGLNESLKKSAQRDIGKGVQMIEIHTPSSFSERCENAFRFHPEGKEDPFLPD